MSGVSESIVAFGGSAIDPRVVRAWIEAARDHLAHECLAGDDADELAAPDDEDGAHLRAHQRLPGLLRARSGLELMRVRDHRVANARRLAAHG